jgi:hypothetical protein
MENQQFYRTKTILCILALVFLVAPLTLASGSISQLNNTNHMRPFPYGMPTIYQHNNSSYIGPFYPPAPYGGSSTVCGPYGCYWTGDFSDWVPTSTLAMNGW